MTDSRLPSRWLTNPDMDGLSDKAWRVFTLALMWANENGTDGAIPRRAYRFLHPDGVTDVEVAELVGAALIVETGDGFTMPAWSTDLGQSSAASVRQARENHRERQKRYRDRQAVESDSVSSSPTDETHNVTRHVTDNATRSNGGKARTGKEVVDSTISESGGELATASWKAARIPNAECAVCGRSFTSPDPGRFTVCPSQDADHDAARGVSR